MSTSADHALCRDGAQLSFGQKLLIGDITPDMLELTPALSQLIHQKLVKQ